MEIHPFCGELGPAFSPAPMSLSSSDHPGRENPSLALNLCSIYYFPIHLALEGDLPGDVLLLCWYSYSNSALPFASSYASVLTLPVDCKVLFLDVCLILLWISPKMPITFSFFKKKLDSEKQTNTYGPVKCLSFIFWQSQKYPGWFALKMYYNSLT